MIWLHVGNYTSLLSVHWLMVNIGPDTFVLWRPPGGTAVSGGRRREVAPYDPDMRYRTLGDSGLLVSVVGLGCNNFGGRLDTARTRAVVDAAIDEGITLLDTAESYGGNGAAEAALGEVLKGRRDKVVLATKFGHQGNDMGYGPAAGGPGGRSYIKLAVE